MPGATNDQIAHFQDDESPWKRRELSQLIRNSMEETNEVNVLIEKQIQDRVECYSAINVHKSLPRGNHEAPPRAARSGV
jgi:hypothetical protein